MRSLILQNYTILVLDSLCTIIIGYGVASIALNILVMHFLSELLMLSYIEERNLIINNPDWRII